MSTLQLEFDTLVEDYNTVMALESVGIARDNPLMESIGSRWCVDEVVRVARESNAEDAEDDTVSLALAKRAADWGSAKETEFKAIVAGRVKLASKLTQKIMDLESALRTTDPTINQIKTGSWTSKLCVKDTLDLDACLRFSEQHSEIDEIAKSFTVFTRAIFSGPKMRKEATFELNKLGSSTGWAVRRGGVLLGHVKQDHTLEGWALPGNVIMLFTEGPVGPAISFATARDGKYGKFISPLNKEECETALKAAYALVKTVHDRQVKTGLFSYAGVYKELDELRAAAGKGILGYIKSFFPFESVVRYKNAIEVEDALSTAQVRVAQGLIEYVSLSLNKG